MHTGSMSQHCTHLPACLPGAKPASLPGSALLLYRVQVVGFDSAGGKKFKSAIEVGVIKSDVADAVTKVTAYEQVRVTDLNKAEATKEVKATKVA